MYRYRVLAMTVSILAMGSPGLAQNADQAAQKADVNGLVQGNSTFALDLYAKLSKKEGNIVVSPYSISTALAIPYGGARGQTAESLAKALRFGLPQDRFHPAFAQLNAGLRASVKDSPNTLLIANALWGQKGSAFRHDFLDLVGKHYDGGLHQVDFANDAEQARAEINRWVQAQTKDKIKDLLPSGSVERDVRLVVTNAIYLKALWKVPFAKDLTKDAPFHVSATQKVTVPMMVMPEKKEGDEGPTFKYGEDDVWQWLELSYKADKMSMVVALPRKKGSLPDAEKKLTAAAVQKSITEMSPRPGTIVLPRFKFSLDVELRSQLQAMGMRSGPFTAISSDEELYLSDVFHKAYIEVDEVGTEAAAATGTILRAINREPLPFRFVADHPFLFFVRDIHSGTILFQGRVSDPSKNESR